MPLFPFTLACSGAALGGGRRAVFSASRARRSLGDTAAALGAQIARLARLRQAPEQPDEAFGPLRHGSLVTLDEGTALPSHEAAPTRTTSVAPPMRGLALVATVYGPAPAVGAGAGCQGGRRPPFLKYVRGTRSRRPCLDELGASYASPATGRSADAFRGVPAVPVATASHRDEDRRTGATRAAEGWPARASVDQRAPSVRANLAAPRELRTPRLPAGARVAEGGHRWVRRVPKRVHPPHASAAEGRA